MSTNVRVIKAGTGLTATEEAVGVVRMDSSDSEIEHDSLSGYVAAEHIDWTQDQSPTAIHANNVPSGVPSAHDLAGAQHNADTLANLNTKISDATLYDWTADQGATNIDLGNVADMVGDSGAGGTHGLVPAPGAGDAAANKFLKADATWAVAGAGDVTASANITDNSIVRGDGGAKGIQGSTATLDDTDVLTLNNKDSKLLLDNQTQDPVGLHVVPSDHTDTWKRGQLRFVDPAGMYSENPVSGQEGWVRLSSVMRNPRAYEYFRDEFYGDFIDTKWGLANSGSGSSTPALESASISTARVKFDAGTTSGGYSRLYLQNTSNNLYYINSSEVSVILRAYVIPTTTSSIEFAFGFTDAASAALNANNLNNIYFHSEPGTNTNWQCCTENGDDNFGAGTKTDSGVAVAGSWTLLEIHYTSGEVNFWIDGALVATHTTNVPDSVGMCPVAQQFNTNTVSEAYCYLKRFESIYRRDLV